MIIGLKLKLYRRKNELYTIKNIKHISKMMRALKKASYKVAVIPNLTQQQY